VARPIAALMATAALALGVQWYRCRDDAAEVREELRQRGLELAAVRRRLEDAQPPAPAAAGQDVAADALTDEEQAALVLQAAAAQDRVDRFATLEDELRDQKRLRERAENAARRADQARVEALDKCEDYLKEHVKLVAERDALATECRRLALRLAALEKLAR